MPETDIKRWKDSCGDFSNIYLLTVIIALRDIQYRGKLIERSMENIAHQVALFT